MAVQTPWMWCSSSNSEGSPACRVFKQDGVSLVVDKVSMEFVKGATIEYAEDLLSSSFRVKDNPIAEQACGCGSSFAAKMDWA
jgi:iron-sulfur cluster assembly accessory protein